MFRPRVGRLRSCALLHVLGESSLGALMDSPKVDKSKVKKIRDYAAQLNGDTVAPAAAASTKGALKQRQSVNQAPPPKAGPKKKKAPKEPKPSAAPAPVKKEVVAAAIADEELEGKISELIPAEIVATELQLFRRLTPPHLV